MVPVEAAAANVMLIGLLALVLFAQWARSSMKEAEREDRRLDLLGFARHMSGGVALALAAALVLWWSGSEAWPVALPFVLAWIASPAIARRASLSPLVAGRVPVSPADARALRHIARRTWRFFETFVTATDHMLPPDNFQEDPKPVVAHRTSPTNLGLYLLSAVSARDFGWAGTLDTVERLEATLETMGKLARFRGHFYNWYDTRDLRPLEPQYVSSVDSGNLAGHLIALANACREWIGAPGAESESFAGIEDALDLTREALRALPEDRRTQAIARHQLDAEPRRSGGSVPDAEALAPTHALHAAGFQAGEALWESLVRGTPLNLTTGNAAVPMAPGGTVETAALAPDSSRMTTIVDSHEID